MCTLRKLAFSLIVCGVLTAFFLEGNLAIWNKSPKKRTIDLAIPLVGFYSNGRKEYIYEDVCLRMLTAELLIAKRKEK